MNLHQSGLLKNQLTMMNSSAKLKLRLTMLINIFRISIVLLTTTQLKRSYNRKFQAIITKLKLTDFYSMKKLTAIAPRLSLELTKD